MNAQNAVLPAVHSAMPTSFASKSDYLAFVKAWKLAYRVLSLTLRIEKLESRQHPSNNPAKAVHLEQSLKAARDRLAALGACPYIANGVGRYALPFRAAEATWMLAYRAAAKVVAARQRAEALAAKA